MLILGPIAYDVALGCEAANVAHGSLKAAGWILFGLPKIELVDADETIGLADAFGAFRQ